MYQDVYRRVAEGFAIAEQATMDAILENSPLPETQANAGPRIFPAITQAFHSGESISL